MRINLILLISFTHDMKCLKYLFSNHFIINKDGTKLIFSILIDGDCKKKFDTDFIMLQ